MPEPQNENEQSDADRAAREAAVEEQRRHDHEDVLAALVGAEATADARQQEATDPVGDGPTEPAQPAEDVDAGTDVQYGVGPFSIREVALGGVWLVAFVVSFFSILPVHATFTSVWTEGINWILSIALPTVAVFLIVLRRLSPSGIRRVGSLGIDQFASVAFSVAAVVWITLAWESVMLTVRYAAATGYSWVVWVESVLMLAGVVLTVFAPIIPVFRDDFRDRPEQPAHRLARPVRPVAIRPRPERPASAPAASAATATPTTVAAPSASAESVDPSRADAAAPSAERTPEALVRPEPEPEPEPESQPEPHPATTVLGAASADAETVAVPTVSQAFWALVPEERAIVDASGSTVFFVGPTAWALVIEDRGDLFVIRHEDGRVGYLRDVSGVTRG